MRLFCRQNSSKTLSSALCTQVKLGVEASVASKKAKCRGFFHFFFYQRRIVRLWRTWIIIVIRLVTQASRSSSRMMGALVRTTIDRVRSMSKTLEFISNHWRFESPGTTSKHINWNLEVWLQAKCCFSVLFTFWSDREAGWNDLFSMNR